MTLTAEPQTTASSTASAATVTASDRGPAPRASATRSLREWPWGFIVLALGGMVAFAAVRDHGTTPVGLPPIAVLIVLYSVIVVAVNLQSTDPGFRAEVSSVALIAMTVAIPAARLPHSDRRILQFFVVAQAVISLSGLLGRSARRAPYGTLTVGLLIAVFALSTAISPDPGANKTLLYVAMPVLAVFLLVGRLDRLGFERLAYVIVAMGFVEGLFAAFETIAYHRHLWAAFTAASEGIANATQGAVQVIQPNKLFGAELARAQGTLGSPLALGFVLALCVALCVRLLPLTRRQRIVIVGVLLLGLIFTGDRNSLILAAIVLAFLSAPRLTWSRAAVAAGVLATAIIGAIAAQVLTSATLDSFTASGSFTHRIGAFQSIGKLLTKQDSLHILIGNGVASTRRIYDAGLLQDDPLRVIDNQYVSTLSWGGLVSATLVLLLTGLVLVRTSPQLRPAVIVTLATWLVFDTLAWPAAAVLTFAVFAAALHQEGVTTAEALPRRRGLLVERFSG